MGTEFIKYNIQNNLYDIYDILYLLDKGIIEEQQFNECIEYILR